MKRILTLKPPRIRSKTKKSTKNLDFLKPTANLAAVETAAHDTTITWDATSFECNNNK